MKVCSQCGALDVAIPTIGTFVNENGEPELNPLRHFVRPFIEYLPEGKSITERQKRLGFHQRTFQARQAIERDLCMDCINANYIRRQLNSEQRRKAAALEKEQTGESNFYLNLADADGCY